MKGIVEAVIGLFLLGYLLHNYNSRSNSSFMCCAIISGCFVYSQTVDFFDPAFKLFGVVYAVVILTGAIAGGVVGALLPKISTGVSLGFLFALLVSTVVSSCINESSGVLSTSKALFMSLAFFVVSIIVSIYFTQKWEKLCADLRSSIALGLCLSLSIDFLLKNGLLSEILNALEMQHIYPTQCESGGCFTFELSMVWVVSTVGSFIFHTNQSGVLKTICSGSGRTHAYSALSTTPPAGEPTASKDRSIRQKTFSYPDTLEYNIFDPDTLPESLDTYAESIFTIVQTLQKLYGFQVDNSRNQAEHLIMLLFNESKSTDVVISAPAARIHSKMFANYVAWCKRMGVQHLLMKDTNLTRYEILIEDLLLFLLVWGEAANLKHMPECLCFVFYKTMQEHVARKTRRGHINFNKSMRYPGYFLDMVVTPVYDVVAEQMRSKGDHVTRKTYDDFNEFFWNPACLKCRIHEESYAAMTDENPEYGATYDGNRDSVELASAMQAASKTYLEKRSWLHPLLSIHRIFEWHVITFTLLAVWGFSNKLQWTLAFTTQVASFIFWEITMMSILWTCLEVWTVYPNVSISTPSIYGFLVRILAGYLILVYQTIYLHWSFAVDSDFLTNIGMFAQGNNIFWWWQYVWLSLLACSLYLLESVLCLVPCVVSSLMTWDNEVFQAFLNICYPLSQLFVGKRVHVPQKEVFGYFLFWITLIGFKLWFGYRYIVGPVCSPSLQLYDDYMNYEKLSFQKTSLLISVWWFPHFLVYLIDLSIWYSVWAGIVGGFYALHDRQGAVRESKAFRTHFMRAPLAFAQKLMPSTSTMNTEKMAKINASTASLSNLMMEAKRTIKNEQDLASSSKKEKSAMMRANKSSADLYAQYDLPTMMSDQHDSTIESIPSKSQTSPLPSSDPPSRQKKDLAAFMDVRSQRWVIFARVWNVIIERLRDNDHINDKEKDIFSFTYFDWLSKPTYLPLYQTAGCVEVVAIAFDEASADYSVERDIQKKMVVVDNFSNNITTSGREAVLEVWELTNWMLQLLLGQVHRNDMDKLQTVLSDWSNTFDIFSRITSKHDAVKILLHVSQIVGHLKGCMDKRKKSPVATKNFLAAYQEKQKQQHLEAQYGNFGGRPVSHGVVGTSSNEECPSPMRRAERSKGGLKKSNSTGFLSALASHEHHSTPTPILVYAPPAGPASPQSDSQGQFTGRTSNYAKLQPFRKTIDLVDLVRDKVREELRLLLTTLRTTLKTRSTNGGKVSTEGQDLIDALTFVLSLETGFFWSDSYASVQIDEIAKNPKTSSVLNKLHGLLTLRVTQVDLKSAEANRRLNFFLNSLFMTIPSVPSSRFTKEYTVVTPYYSEDILLNKADLESKNSDGVSTLLYLQTLYKNDWINFMERRNIHDDDAIWANTHLQELRCWASLRAQTLYRTVEGMMYTEAATKLLAELEELSDSDVDLLSKIKFNYVVACQVYGTMRKNSDSKADDIEFLMARHPNLRVAYIDSTRVNRAGDIAYYSVLVKHDPHYIRGTKRGEVKEVYRIKLPGNPVLGEGKPENQNHALIFSRGRYLQAIDMNQDGYFEESLKMRNALEEFESGVSILGLREHIFTGSVSSVANYMALQELSFVTLGQRVLSKPLHIRQHYGHPDVFDKFFVMTMGGMSKASKGINLSEDVFAGFNATIRGKTVGFTEYIQVGKGRDVGLQQTYKFEAKLSQGNAEQSLSRDLNRICDRLDFFRLMSFYYGGIGHYIANTMVMFTLVVVVYIMLSLAVYKEEGVNGRALSPEGLLQLLLAGMGLLQTWPLCAVLTVEKGFMPMLSEIGYMFLSGGPLYFIFHIETKCYYFSQTLLAGGAMYRPTGRGFVIRHSPFDENYRFFAGSHIYLGFELTVALVLFAMYTSSEQYLGLTWALWLTAISFVLGPFWFNPLSFEWNKIAEDYTKWMGWMMEVGGTSEQSWETWWKEENNFYNNLSTSWRIVLIVQKCALWLFVAAGLFGHHLWSSSKEETAVLLVMFLFLFYVTGNWLINKMEKVLSYAGRRLLSLALSTGVATAVVYLFCMHPQYIRYTMGMYYVASAACFTLLVTGNSTSVAYMYKLHDYLVGHFIFSLLSVMAVMQLGYFQTWLLYHNALSSGVEIEDILKYARKTKQRANTDTDTINDLKLQVAQQERLIRQIIDQGGYGSMGQSGPPPKGPMGKAKEEVQAPVWADQTFTGGRRPSPAPSLHTPGQPPRFPMPAVQHANGASTPPPTGPSRSSALRMPTSPDSTSGSYSPNPSSKSGSLGSNGNGSYGSGSYSDRIPIPNALASQLAGSYTNIGKPAALRSVSSFVLESEEGKKSALQKPLKESASSDFVFSQPMKFPSRDNLANLGHEVK